MPPRPSIGRSARLPHGESVRENVANRSERRSLNMVRCRNKRMLHEKPVRKRVRQSAQADDDAKQPRKHDRVFHRALTALPRKLVLRGRDHRGK